MRERYILKNNENSTESFHVLDSWYNIKVQFWNTSSYAFHYRNKFVMKERCRILNLEINLYTEQIMEYVNA